MYRNRVFISSVSHRFMSAKSASCDTKMNRSPLKEIGKPEKIRIEFWKKILWVAMDLKETVSRNDKINMNLLETKHVTLLFTKPHGRFELSFTLACDLLGAKKTLYLDPHFENHPNPSDSIRVLAQLTDMFIMHGLQHDILVRMVENCPRPIYSASCNAYCFQKALSDLMTYMERFHCLRNLTVAWIGPPLSIFNSYLLLCSSFGINIQYTCICLYGSGRMSPVHRFQREENIQVDEGKKHKMKEFKTAKEAVKDAHIISTSCHPEEENKITLELLQEADPNWVFMHTLPRSKREVSDDVFYHKNNLSWKTSENYLYVAMAIILITLKKYRPRIKMPDFDGVERGDEENSH